MLCSAWHGNGGLRAESSLTPTRRRSVQTLARATSPNVRAEKRICYGSQRMTRPHELSQVPRRQFLTLIVISGALGSSEAIAGSVPEKHRLSDSGKFPNSHLPALIYRGALSSGDLASAFERRFEANHWTGSWRNGLFSTHHYHSTAHEVLGIYQGSVQARLGGESGPLVKLSAGDVAVLPAGVAHKNEKQSSDFRVVGAYPTGTSADMQYGAKGERPRTDENIRRVPKPQWDPLFGKGGPLPALWT